MTATCPVDHGFDPLSPEYLRDPGKVLRSPPAEQQPVFYAPVIDMYVVTLFEDVEQVFLDPAPSPRPTLSCRSIRSCPEAQQILLDGGHRPQPSMVSLDPPAHTRLREPTARAFTPRRVREMEPRIRATVGSCSTRVDAAQPFDLVAGLRSRCLPRSMFSFMGVPEADWPQLKEWCGSRAALAWGRRRRRSRSSTRSNMVAYRATCASSSARRRRTAETTSRARCSRSTTRTRTALTQEEIASILFSLSFAGHETTNNLIGNSVRGLLEDRSRWERLLADPILDRGRGR